MIIKFLISKMFAFPSHATRTRLRVRLPSNKVRLQYARASAIFRGLRSLKTLNSRYHKNLHMPRSIFPLFHTHYKAASAFQKLHGRNPKQKLAHGNTPSLSDPKHTHRSSKHRLENGFTNANWARCISHAAVITFQYLSICSGSAHFRACGRERSIESMRAGRW